MFDGCLQFLSSEGKLPLMATKTYTNYSDIVFVKLV